MAFNTQKTRFFPKRKVLLLLVLMLVVLVAAIEVP